MKNLISHGRSAIAAAYIILAATNIFSQDTDYRILRVIVEDAKESRIIGARVEARIGDDPAVICGPDREWLFTCRLYGTGRVTLNVRAEGFRPIVRTIELPGPGEDIRKVILEVLPLSEEVFVSAARSESILGETPASIVSLDRTDLSAAAAPGIDDALRQTIGFSLFRRSNSRTANPTSQGTSLRGINASGASRSLVLLDSVPLNDPFGGWVTWSSVPPISVERIEVLRGGASSLYGSDSLGGTVNIFSRKPEKRLTLSAEAYGGTQETASSSVFSGAKTHNFSVDASAFIFHTDGYVPVDELERGSVDNLANSRNFGTSLRIEPMIYSSLKLFFGGSYFGESRNNGTPAQTNGTRLRRFFVGADPSIPDLIPGTSDSRLSVRAYGILQVYDQSFSAVASDRDSESLTRIQRVPSQKTGVSLLFSTYRKAQSITAGIEWSETRGTSDETGFFSGNAVSKAGSGGRERTFGLFVQDVVRVGSRLVMTGRLRVEAWSNYRALRSETLLGTGQTVTRSFPDRSETAVSPAGTALVRITDWFSGYFSISGSFRAPTLNELYRGFRVGNVITSANEDLRAEKARNFEGGISLGKGAFFARAAVYQTDIADAVANVTTGGTSSLILRQRRNAARVRVRGFEFEAERREGNLTVAFGYLLSDAIFARFPASSELEGLRIPQTPAHQFTAQARYAGAGGIVVSLQARGSSGQFDDDLNVFRLGSFFQLDVFASKNFRNKLQVFAAVENLLNSRYSVGLTPVRTVSAPIAFRAGVRWN